MAPLDKAVSSVLDKHHRTAGDDSDEDEDALITALEQEDDSNQIAGIREQRLQQLHSELSRAKQLRNSDHGSYTEVKDEKQVLDITTSTKLCVVHFMKPDFARCRVMDQRLEALAPSHFDTRFLSINVENCPFLVAKLKVQVLPCVICFVNGVGVDRIIGFEGIGYRTDTFSLSELEARLLKARVLVRAKMSGADEGNVRKQSNGRSNVDMDDTDDDEWD